MKELCIGRTRGGGISIVDTRERYKTRVRVVNTEMPVRVNGKGERARREEYILT